MRHLIIIPVLSLIAVSAAAQRADSTLTGTINIQTQITPTLQPLHLPQSLPQQTLPATPAAPRPHTATPETVPAPEATIPLDLRPDTLRQAAPSPFELTLGYLPSHNALAALTLRPVQNARHNLAIDLSYSMTLHNTISPYENSDGGNTAYDYDTHALRAAALYQLTLASTATLDVAAGYDYNRRLLPTGLNSDLRQTTNTVGLSAVFHNPLKASLPLTLSLALQHHGTPLDHYYNNDSPAATRYTDYDNSETTLDIAATATIPLKNKNTLNITLRNVLQHQSEHISLLDSYFVGNTGASNNANITTLSPSLTLRPRHDLRLKLGVSLDYAHTTIDGGTMHIAPDVVIQYTPRATVAAQLTVTGGTRLVTLPALLATHRYIITPVTPDPSYTPMDATLSLRLTPHPRFNIRPYVNYTITHDNPTLAYDASTQNTGYHSLDTHGARYGVTLTYAPCNTLDILGDIHLMSHTDADDANPRNSHASNYDQAPLQTHIALSYKPIESLNLSLSHTYRPNRHTNNITRMALPVPADGSTLYYAIVSTGNTTDLGAINDLSFGADYDITSRLNLGLHLNNLLCRRYLLTPSVPSQRLNGMLTLRLRL